MISYAASASNMENGTVEHERASNMEEDKASSPNMENDIERGSALDIEMAKDILKTLNTGVRQMPTQQNGSESLRSECCIYRVPNQLRNVNSKAYDPNLISIGPLHRENKGLEAMEKEKLNYFRKLTEQYGMDEKEMCDIVISIKNQEERLRHCYSEKSILMESSDDFVKMILLDAVFIILFFLESKDDTDGPKNFESRMKDDIREDLLLLENQLPLFIIQEIYDRVNPRGQEPIPFLDLATCHLRKYLGFQEEETSPGVEGSRHFTDLLRNLMLSGAFKRRYSFNPVKLKYSAVRLHEVGVKFQVTRDKCLVNIAFDRGVLKIPKLEVDHNFDRLVRNIMALEQYCYSSEAYICSYIKFMDRLIDNAKDVALLVENEIIVHWLCDDVAVSNMINNICKNIDDKYTCFGDISQELNAICENPWNQSRPTLKLVYFPNIWRGTATVAAAILLILTFIQTISSVKSLF